MLHSFIYEDFNFFLAEWTDHAHIFVHFFGYLSDTWTLHFNVLKISGNVPGIDAPKENKNLKTSDEQSSVIWKSI